MTLATLAIKDLFSNPLRLGLTVLAATVGVMAFAFLQTVIDFWYTGVAGAQADRLIVRNKTSLTQPLPLAYLSRIRAVPGVSAVTWAGWFGGTIGESQRDFFPNVYVDPTSFLEVYDEYTAPPEQVSAWKADPCGAVIGDSLAQRFGWKVGDRVTLQGTIFPGDWVFTVRGIYRGIRPNVDTTVMAFGYRCVNERVPEEQKDLVGYYTLRVDDPSRSPAIAAQIDGLFANSPWETRTESERAFQLSFVAMSSAILSAVEIVSYVILVIILLVVGNTLAMGIREKTVGLSTLRALGFKRRHIVALVLSESVLIGALSALLGLALAPILLQAFLGALAQQFGPTQNLSIRPITMVWAAAASVLVGLLAGAVPALQAARIPIAEGLRKVA